MKRELPVINIKGTDFVVDVNKLELVEKKNHKNVIPFEDMSYTDHGYIFEYNLNIKNLPRMFDRESTTVKIPEFVILDPIGMANKCNHPLSEIKGKSDFYLMVDQQAFDQRVKKGMLPTVDIAGHTFYVDIPMDMLRPKDDFLSKGIVFSDIENYYDLEKRTYTIPYNPKTHEFQEPDYLNIKELPKDLIAVRFPFERLLDRIGWNRKYRFEITHGLVKNGLKLQFAAKNVPWEETFLLDLIKINRRIEKRQRDSEPKQLKQSRCKGRKM